MPKRSIATTKEVLEKDNTEDLLGNKGLLDNEDNSDSEDSVYSGLEEEDDTDNEREESDVDDEESEDEEDDEENASKDDIDTTEDANSDDDIVDLSDNENESNEISIKQRSPEISKEALTKQVFNKSIPNQQVQFEEVDTSDEEDIRNTVGNIPMEWYNDYPHIGYSVSGKRIMKPAQGDQLDDLLSKMDDPNHWRTVYDKTNMQNIKLTDDEIDLIQRIQAKGFPEHGYDPYEPYVDWFTGEKMIHPIKDNPESKNSFIPSKWEHKKVMRIVRAIRNGWIKPKVPADKEEKFYKLWSKDDVGKDHPMHWPAPKVKLPGHEESYNPPSEYLPTEEEIASWEAMDPEDRPQNFLSKKYDALRKVPGYSNFIQENFERCLDLYLCPRQRKIRLQVDPEDLIPKLPKPRDLQPYPTTEYIVYRGHTQAVHCISVDPSGQWMVSGSADETIRFWEVSTGRSMKSIPVSGPVHSIDWNPEPSMPIVAAAVGDNLIIINPQLGDKLISSNVDNRFKSFTSDTSSDSIVKWETASRQEQELGIRLKVAHEKAIRQVCWHSKGDYFCTMVPEGGSKTVIIHQLSKQKSQCPFKKLKGQVQCARFHPTRPFFFVATQRYVRVYNLQKQELVKKLVTGVKWISSIDIHPKGDNLIIGSYDRRLCWFDMDLSSKPYKTLRHHKKAIRQVSYHSRYPLFASASDDGMVIVSHGMVYSDLMQNPLIVPLKIIRGHKITNDLGVIDCKFHPHQPWLFTAGADSTIRLFT